MIKPYFILKTDALESNKTHILFFAWVGVETRQRQRFDCAYVCVCALNESSSPQAAITTASNSGKPALSNCCGRGSGL